MKTTTESVRLSLWSFFEGAAEDLELTVDNVTWDEYGLNRAQGRGDCEVITYTTTALIPVLTALFLHDAQRQHGGGLIGKREQKRVECMEETAAVNWVNNEQISVSYDE